MRSGGSPDQQWVGWWDSIPQEGGTVALSPDKTAPEGIEPTGLSNPQYIEQKAWKIFTFSSKLDGKQRYASIGNRLKLTRKYKY